MIGYICSFDPACLHFTGRQLRDDLMTLLIAGHETTAAMLTWATALVCSSSGRNLSWKGIVSTNVLYICKTASLRCVAKHRNSNGPNVQCGFMNLTSSFCGRALKKTLAGFPSLFMSWWSPRIVTFWMSYTKRHGKSAGAGWRLMFLLRFFVGETKASQLGKHVFFLQASMWKVDSLEGRNPTFEEWGCGYGQWGEVWQDLTDLNCVLEIHTFNVDV